MNSTEVKAILMQCGVKHLYHVNSVLTALTYLENGGLLSRETVEKRGLPQTPQKTDSLDQLFNIYNDIFFDSVDIHERSRNVNHYGPITFVYSIDVLDELSDYDVLVTKKNPAFWKETATEEDKYFLDGDELSFFFELGNFGQHITIKNISQEISFQNLEEIIIEDPGEKHIDLFKNASNALISVMEKNKLMIPLSARNCPKECHCREKYENAKNGYAYYRFKIK